ncbi:BREX system P-loop protein BrxC [Carnobacterium gallinarum]
MEIKQLFTKDITREIKGVIKIGQSDNENRLQELEEYVVTSELQKHMQQFFSAYCHALNEPTDRMGVWISGFFGSGKSHFLKILSYLLANEPLDKGQLPIEFFDEKIENKHLFQKIKLASGQKNQVVLFNIDSKSESDNKQNKLAVVRVFNKVFNEMLGYSSSIPWLAHLEEILVEKGEYEKFKAFFEEESGLTWEEGRDEVYYNEDEMVHSLVKATGRSEESARRWIENGEENYELSVDSFTKRVSKYVANQEESYRLIFMVDEMGQYISDNTKLMLNLQTLVEDLGKLTNGKVWVIVTSQQDIEALKEGVGSMNDFSKIQSRFHLKLSLSSANADEVIKKRLLDKKEEASQLLQKNYTIIESSLKNKLVFSEKTVDMKIYKDKKEFEEVYPFIPYQFHLLQKVFTSIREHGSAGKHLADGERNLLEAIQQAALHYQNENVGLLVPFYIFYESIDQALEHSIRSSIIKAKQSDDLEEEDISVLKLLFLIRYVKEVPATLENLVTLMITRVDEDKLLLSQRIKASLERLEKSILIQKNSEEYVFLTNEEQDINREIDQVQVSNNKVIHQIGKMIFEDILELKRFSYEPFENRKSVVYHYDIATWIDGQAVNNSAANLGVHILTPYFEEADSLENMIALSAKNQQVVIILNETSRYYEDMLKKMKIQEYLRSHMSGNLSEITRQIVTRKTSEHSELGKQLKIQLHQALEQGICYVNGMVIKEKVHTPIIKINKSLGVLIEHMYSKLSYMTKHYQVDELAGLVKYTQGNIFQDNSTDPNHLATEELLQDIKLQTERHSTIVLREMLQQFMKKPTGWREVDIIASFIYLLKDEKIFFKKDGINYPYTDSQFVRTVTRKNYQEKIVIGQRKLIPEKHISISISLVKDTTGKQLDRLKEDLLAQQIREVYQKQLTELEQYLMNYHHQFYPGKELIDEGIKQVKLIINKQNTEDLLRYLFDKEEEILSCYDELYIVKSFFENHMPIYDKSTTLKERYEKDFNLLVNEKVREAGSQICQILKQSHPYHLLKELPALNEEFIRHMVEELEIASEPILSHLKTSKEALLENIATYPKAKKELERSILDGFNRLKDKIEHAETLSTLNGYKFEIENLTDKYLQQVQRIIDAENRHEKAQQKQVSIKKESESISTIPVVEQKINKEPQKKIFQKKDILPIKSIDIQTENELRNYLSEIESKLLAALNAGQIIRIL